MTQLFLLIEIMLAARVMLLGEKVTPYYTNIHAFPYKRHLQWLACVQGDERKLAGFADIGCVCVNTTSGCIASDQSTLNKAERGYGMHVPLFVSTTVKLQCYGKFCCSFIAIFTDNTTVCLLQTTVKVLDACKCKLKNPNTRK